jgi:FtsP/CotA-like multicopper oxidase with cupredoxin domain
MHHHTQSDPLATESYPTDPSGLPEAGRPQLLELADGDTLELQVGPVAKRLGEATVRMLGYNGSIPGPILKVQQGSEIIVHVENHGDLDTTVHWHGLRLENKYDGVPHETQAPIPVGGEFTYRIQFPDAGLYWYHPHIRGGLHPGAGPVRQHPRRPHRAGLLAAGRPGRRPDRG